MADGKIEKLNEWQVLAIEGKGLFIKGDGDPWKIASEEQLMRRNDELSKTYRKAMQ